MTKLPSLTIGSAGSPASFHRAVAQLQRYRGPAIITSFGPDLYSPTATARSTRGEILRYDPFQLAGGPGETWSPFASVASWDDALDVAWQLTLAGQHDQRTIEHGDFWAILVEERLAPMLWAAAHSGSGIDSLVAWAYGQRSKSFDEAVSTIITSGERAGERSDALALHRSIEEFSKQPDRIRTSVDATIQALLRAFRFSRVAASAEDSAITADALFSGSNTVYLVSDAKAAKLLRPLMTTLLEQLVLGALDSDRTLLLARVDGQITTATCPGAEALTRTGKIRTLTIPPARPSTPVSARRRLQFRSPLIFG